MNKRFLIHLVIVLVLFASACSYSTGFTVANSSDKPLEVYYELKSSGMMPLENIIKPAVITLKEFNNGEFQWRNLPADKFSVDAENGVVKALIQPNEVLLELVS